MAVVPDLLFLAFLLIVAVVAMPKGPFRWAVLLLIALMAAYVVYIYEVPGVSR
jgi:hypothetical protein